MTFTSHTKKSSHNRSFSHSNNNPRNHPSHFTSSVRSKSLCGVKKTHFMRQQRSQWCSYELLTTFTVQFHKSHLILFFLPHETTLCAFLLPLCACGFSLLFLSYFSKIKNQPCDAAQWQKCGNCFSLWQHLTYSLSPTRKGIEMWSKLALWWNHHDNCTHSKIMCIFSGEQGAFRR